MILAAPVIPRFVLVAPIAIAVTFALAMLMQMLVAQRSAFSTDRTETAVIQILSNLVETEPPIRVWPEPVPPTPAPDRPDVTSTAEPGGPPVGPIVEGPESAEPEVGRSGQVWIAAPPRRLYTPLPQYPSNAGDREGSCIVAFDVDDRGKVRNARATSCTASVFARAAENAVSRSVYQPATGEDGPVATMGLALEIVFQIER